MLIRLVIKISFRSYYMVHIYGQYYIVHTVWTTLQFIKNPSESDYYMTHIICHIIIICGIYILYHEKANSSICQKSKERPPKKRRSLLRRVISGNFIDTYIIHII